MTHRRMLDVDRFVVATVLLLSCESAKADPERQQITEAVVLTYLNLDAQVHFCEFRNFLPTNPADKKARDGLFHAIFRGAMDAGLDYEKISADKRLFVNSPQYREFDQYATFLELPRPFESVGRELRFTMSELEWQREKQKRRDRFDVLCRRSKEQLQEFIETYRP